LNNGEVNAVELKNDTDVVTLRNAINAIFKLDGPASRLAVRSPNAAAEPLNPRDILASVVKRDAASGDYEVYVEVPPKKEAFFLKPEGFFLNFLSPLIVHRDLTQATQDDECFEFKS